MIGAVEIESGTAAEEKVPRARKRLTAGNSIASSRKWPIEFGTCHNWRDARAKGLHSLSLLASANSIDGPHSRPCSRHSRGSKWSTTDTSDATGRESAIRLKSPPVSYVFVLLAVNRINRADDNCGSGSQVPPVGLEWRNGKSDNPALLLFSISGSFHRELF